MTTQKAVLYLRSSKDRSDVSIDAQRRELVKLAADRGILLAGEYADVVVSANDEDRPGLVRMLSDMKLRDRAWTRILVLDTSRLARNVYFAQFFGRECEKQGVQVIYSKVPTMDPIIKIMLMPVLQANDELHSYMSRVKGLAGMRENVLKGFRAGGRAPWGYRLKRTNTGSVREGLPVTKTTLEPDPTAAPIVRRYLQMRAQGISRARAARDAGARQNPTSLVGTDWQALTYAGHTVWNVHNTVTPDGYRTGRKRKPRAEWVIQRETHEPLIANDEAERILRALEASPMRVAVSHAKAQMSRYVLAGLLKTPDGANWHGCQQRSNAGEPVGYYRGGNRLVLASSIEGAVVTRVIQDLRSGGFAEGLARTAAKHTGRKREEDPAKALRREQQRLAKEIDCAMELAAKLADPGPAIRRVDALEAQRRAMTLRIEDAELAAQQRRALAQVTPEGIQGILASIAGHIEQLLETHPEDLRELLETLVDRVELAPDGRTATIHYAIDAVQTCEPMASPRGCARSTGLRILRQTSVVTIQRRRRAA